MRLIARGQTTFLRSPLKRIRSQRYWWQVQLGVLPECDDEALTRVPALTTENSLGRLIKVHTCVSTAKRVILSGEENGGQLTHHCDIVETGNTSWRFKNRS